MPKLDENDTSVAQNAAVLNPYALAEVVSRRRINWKQVKDKPRLLETILQTPYSELFDPKYEGPLYTGLKLDNQQKLQRVRSPLLDVEVKLDINDLQESTNGMSREITKLADIGPRFGTSDIGSIEVRQATVQGRYLVVSLRLPEAERLQKLIRVLTKDIVKTIAVDPAALSSNDDWTPPGASWGDAGRFFNETAEFFDPIQGAVANCYFIAALSAVAWASPFRIQHLTRASGQNQTDFVNLIRFFKPDSGGQLDKEIEVTDAVPLSSSGGGFLYCRSSESGEIWPAVYEKAYAKHLTNVAGDHPNILATAWGDCVWATAQLTGGQRFYYDNASRTGDQLWDLVRGNSRGGRTFNPMTAWTYSSGDQAPKKVVYADGNIVGSHCYTVLGWDYRDGQKYLLVRNPWGHTEATVGALNATTFLYDISWWRSIDLTLNDGTFGIEANAFQRYFAGLGVAK